MTEQQGTFIPAKSEAFTPAATEITKYVQEGDNAIRIQYGNGSTHYWIKWLLIETD